MKYILSSFLFVVLFTQCSPKIQFSNLGDNTLYGIQGKLVAKEGKGKELSKILLDASALMQSVQGCRLYAVSMDNNNLHVVWVTEIWDSKEDHDNSLKIQGVRELIGKAMPLLDGSPRKGQELTILGGLGIR